MNGGRFGAAKLVLCTMALAGLTASAQQPGSRMQGQAGSAQGTLTVTLTVVPSVGVITGPDGEQRIIVANAADPKDNVSSLQEVRQVTLTPVAAPKTDAKPTKAKRKKL